MKYISLLLAFLLLGFTSCETVDFGDTNVNPNSPSDAPTKALLTNAQRSISGYVAATTPNLYVQYLSNGQYDEESRYQTLNWNPNGWYAVMTDLVKIIELNTNDDTKVSAQANGSNANQIAAAMILKAYIMHGMTDRWGYLPYSEALNGLDNPFPKYDSQQEIYTALFNELDQALAMIDGGPGVVGDIFFNGDMDMWAKFANTIKMTMALRLAKADPTTGAAKFNEALGNAISSNAENIKYQYLSEDTNDNPWQDRFETRRDYLVSDVFVNALIGSGTSTSPEDPRLEKMAEPSFNFTGEFRGAPYGISNSATDDYSFITNDIINTSDSANMIYTYAEVLFARAEAAALGWTSEDPATLFADAITASMEQWGVDSADAATYVGNHPYTGLSDIGYEKWVAQYMQGYNSWASWRRQTAMGHGMPLTPPADMLSNATGIPQRHGYSATASSLNEDNYNAAVSAQGADDLNTVLWTNQ